MSDLTDLIASAFGIPSEAEPLGDAVQRALRAMGAEPNATSPIQAGAEQADSDASTDQSWGVVHPASLEGKPVPPRQWCVPDWVPDKVVTLFSGDGGTGKSLLALQLATCCALGLPFMGMELARRKVLYVAAGRVRQ